MNISILTSQLMKCRYQYFGALFLPFSEHSPSSPHTPTRSKHCQELCFLLYFSLWFYHTYMMSWKICVLLLVLELWINNNLLCILLHLAFLCSMAFFFTLTQVHILGRGSFHCVSIPQYVCLFYCKAFELSIVMFLRTLYMFPHTKL